MSDFQSKLWQEADDSVILWDPNAQAGLGVLSLPKSSWLTHGACAHDPGYVAKSEGKLPDEAKGMVDCIFFEVCHIDARAMTGAEDGQKLMSYDDYNKRAELYTELALAWLAIRSPIGILAWRT